MRIPSKVLVAALCLSLVFGYAAAAEAAQIEREARKEGTEFEQLKFSYKSEGVEFSATSEVYRIAPAKRDAVNAYVFVYTFKNNCEKRIKVLFPAQRILLSLLTQILQDFAISLELYGGKTVVILTNAVPEIVSTQTVIAVRSDNDYKWLYFGGESTRLYVPLVKPDSWFICDPVP